ncbi:MAG: hypothetical protein ACI4BD_05525 [Paludibacteraceae bacterium]
MNIPIQKLTVMPSKIPDTHPAIARLRMAVEKKYGHMNSTLRIQLFAEEELKNALNADTIRRIWGVRHTNSQTIYRSSLDILCRYVGYPDWDIFVDQTNNEKADSGWVATCAGVDMRTLPVGQIVLIVWQPNRIMQVRYDGNQHFCIEQVTHSTMLLAEDEFDCSQMIVGVPAILTNLTRHGQNLGEYVIGRGNGLSEVKIK